MAFLFPLVNVSCSEKVVAEPNVYEFISGVTPETVLDEETSKAVNEMKEKDPRVKAFFEQPIKTSRAIIPVAVAVALAAACAFITPVGSLAMALAAFASLWVFIYNLSATVVRQHYDFLTVEPAVGAYCISFLLVIGIAMDLAVIIKNYRLNKQKQKEENTQDHHPSESK
ncbi:hypothetical protein [Hallerella sp.]|uniref:hypothetical protein n=1 Tax=Hallerella sp. TaxID=2815812 RepID=UPI002590E544|nr:hypothetical protein [Hallerella sp.]MCI6874429.1 hypothetical protein [Hallerella sp.]